MPEMSVTDNKRRIKGDANRFQRSIVFESSSHTLCAVLDLSIRIFTIASFFLLHYLTVTDAFGS